MGAFRTRLRLRLRLLLLLALAVAAAAKSTIEPCSVSNSCPALLGYTLYADLKVSEVAGLFAADPFALLSANAFDFSVSDVANRILPAGLFVRVPTLCSCVDGIRKSVSVRYRTRPADTLASIADTIYAGLASADQIREANSISDPSALGVGQNLVIPLPCTCFNSSDNGLPAVYLSYVIRDGETVQAIAAEYFTTVTDIMNANAMGSPAVRPGDIIAVPLPACPSLFPRFASDFGMIVANSTYVVTASHCVQCSCGLGNLNLYCSPTSLSVSCSSMQCKNSSLMIGNVTAQQTTAGCRVTSCNYGGFVNGTIVATLTTSLQPRCPGQHQFPSVISPPTTVIHESFIAPSSAPSSAPVQAQPGGIMLSPRSSVSGVSGTFSLPGVSPATGPAGSVSEASLVSSLCHLKHILAQCLVLFLLM